MTVSSQTSTATFVGNGAATAFPLPFRFFSNSDIRAYFIDSTTGAATPMALGADYTLLGAGEPEVDGSALSLLTTVVPLASMRGLYVERVIPQVQETDIVNQGQFFASTHEDVFDRLTMLIQQSNANGAGAIRVAIGDPDPTRLPPAQSRANQLMGFDSQGNPVPVSPSGGSIEDFAIRLLNNTDPAQGAALVGFKGRTVYAHLSELINVKDYGAKGDNIANDTPAINSALAAAISARKSVYFPAGVYKLSESSPGSGYCLLNRGVPMIGEGAPCTWLVPDPALPAEVDYILIQPTAADVLDFVELKGLFVYPNAPGNKRGRRALFVDMTAVSNATAFHIEGCYFAPGNNYSFEWYTDPANVQGGPANSLFERSMFWEGVKLTNHGDSNTFRNCVLRSSAGSGRQGINTKSIFAGGGQASQLTVEQCNFDCDGGAILALNGLKYTIINNNIEQSHGTGSAAGACIDLDGTEGGVAWATYSGNSAGAFTSAALSTILRINNAAHTKVCHNRFSSALAGNAGVAISITANATDTIIEQNEIGTNFPVTINNLGVGTRGVPKDLTPINGFANIGSGYAPLSAIKDPADGALRLNGFLSAPAAPNGLIVAVLPAGMRPAFSHSVGVKALIGGSSAMATIEISSNGNMTYFGGVAAQISLGGITLGGIGFISGNL